MREEEDILVEKARQGDKNSFGDLYEIYLPKIYRFVLLKVTHKGDAEDITHQVFTRAWENIRSFKFQGVPFSSWLYRIAQNAVIDFYRTKKSSVPIEDVDETEFQNDDNHEHNFEKNEALRSVMRAVKLLKPDEQSVILMRFVDELSSKETALALGKTEGAVRVIQHRAVKQLQKYLEHGI